MRVTKIRVLDSGPRELEYRLAGLLCDNNIDENDVVSVQYDCPNITGYINQEFTVITVTSRGNLP